MYDEEEWDVGPCYEDFDCFDDWMEELCPLPDPVKDVIGGEEWE